MVTQTRVDIGNYDWVVMEDNDGNVWIRPSLGWSDGEVYESLRDGQEIVYDVLERANGIEVL